MSALVLVGCAADSDDDGLGCDPRAVGRCVGDVIQVCTANAATRSFQWVDVIDCREMWDDVCFQKGEGTMPGCGAPADAGPASLGSK
jgi:hypothetical protein